jgi:hypothetical protein
MDVMFPRDSNLLKDTTEVGDVRAEIASGRHVLHERPLCPASSLSERSGDPDSSGLERSGNPAQRGCRVLQK